MEDEIIIKGARVHNLKNINLRLPKNKLIVFSGVSGSGKSSLAFDTIFAEGQRRYLESLSPYARQFLGQMDKPDVDEILGLSPAIAIDQKALSHNPRSTVGTLTEIHDYLRVLFARMGEVFCPLCGEKIQKLSLDEMTDIIKEKAKNLKNKTVTILSPVVRGRKGEYYQMLYDFLSLGYSFAYIDSKKYSLHDKIELSRYKNHTIEIVIDTVLIDDESRLFEAIENATNYSKGLVKVIFEEEKPPHKIKETLLLSSLWTCPKDNFAFPEVEPRLFSFNSPYGACPACHGLGKEDIFTNEICPVCEGKRLKPEALAVKINGKNIYELSNLSVDQLYLFFNKYEANLKEKEKIIVADLIKTIKERLKFLSEVGLSYLSLSREAETLSGGEAQRIRLASQIGSQLSNALYVLDEPTIGLHERDTDKLIKILETLKERNNTIIVVEHDEKTIYSSDYLVDLGPGAGVKGGYITACGKTEELIENEKKYQSLTLDYLRGKRTVFVQNPLRGQITEKLKIIGARANNLKNINVEIPLRKLVVVTGVSGSGKSSLIYDVLYKNLVKLIYRLPQDLEKVSKILGSEYLDRVVMVTQAPIGRTPRSNPATYTGIFTPIREFYASLEEARQRGYSASRFSFNVKGGRCEACEGAGYKLIEMHFLPPVLVECEVCHGKRFNRETLQVKYQGKNISEVLDLTVEEALQFFEGIYPITEKLQVLKEVGLGYIKLGQSATTLSGGEAQRIKLARELTHPLGRRVLYLLDEPTVGLHYYDIEMLLKVLIKLIEKGNSVIMIEHNMHVIKCADYIIDLGPEGGEKGGRLIIEGIPQEIIKTKNSYTGQYLKHYLQ
ncbi:MAG TPA: excinuclease ABC subunit UvrA [Candidatus Paceibacterota bacterium]|nr:excinuclease ABC subunit UvrA [Candidatus Paceibacterota bacterium]HOK97230.1 excinuclease ABC subunit UvrA [Candidatus Paceibacterota bacterium]HPP64579.1 excinuclease ABC subunit UvrA [Candidatus Paceibacterota bacterium]